MWEEREVCGRRGRCVGGEGGEWEEREVCGRRGRCVGGEGGVWEEREVCGRRGRCVPSPPLLPTHPPQFHYPPTLPPSIPPSLLEEVVSSPLFKKSVKFLVAV